MRSSLALSSIFILPEDCHLWTASETASLTVWGVCSPETSARETHVVLSVSPATAEGHSTLSCAPKGLTVARQIIASGKPEFAIAFISYVLEATCTSLST